MIDALLTSSHIIQLFIHPSTTLSEECEMIPSVNSLVMKVCSVKQR